MAMLKHGLGSNGILMYQILCDTIRFDHTGKYFSPVQDSAFFHDDFREWAAFKQHFGREPYLFFKYWLTENMWEINQHPHPFAELYLHEPDMIYWHTERNLFDDDFYKELLPAVTRGLSHLAEERNCRIVLFVPSGFLASNVGADFKNVVTTQAKSIIKETYFDLSPAEAMALFSEYLFGYFSHGHGFMVETDRLDQFWMLIDREHRSHNWYHDILDTVLLHFEPMRDLLGFTIASVNIGLKEFIIESDLEEINNGLLKY